MVADEHWKSEPEEHDYPAATDYLSLVAPPALVQATVEALRAAPLVHRKAKDLLRASRLPLLSTSNVHVTKNFKKVLDGGKLSPVLIVRGNIASDSPLTVADGYHRICASHHLNEDADIPCQLVDLVQRDGPTMSG
ncbi:MAG: hypothetical protein M3N98_09020 [Actinomycetota bacterium]|nr:hypothetical protein [Actinomycetota bacterium]